MEIKTVMAIVEALGEGIVKKQDGVDNCIAHIAQLDAVNQRLIAENKKMKEELEELKKNEVSADTNAPITVADCGRFGIAQGADTSEEVCHGVGEMGYCNGDCCPDGSAYDPKAVDG